MLLHILLAIVESKYLYETLTSYIKGLSKKGTVNKKEQEDMLILCFIYLLLNSELSVFLDEKSYKEVSSFLYDLYGSGCSIPYPEFKALRARNNSNSIITVSPVLRITQDSIRVTPANTRVV